LANGLVTRIAGKVTCAHCVRKMNRRGIKPC
jgi:hypothetical protein